MAPCDIVAWQPEPLMQVAAVISGPAWVFLWAFRQQACSAPVGQHAPPAANAAAANGANPAKEKNSARHTAAAPRSPLRNWAQLSMPSREVYHNSDPLHPVWGRRPRLPFFRRGFHLKKAGQEAYPTAPESLPYSTSWSPASERWPHCRSHRTAPSVPLDTDRHIQATRARTQPWSLYRRWSPSQVPWSRPESSPARLRPS